jgi:CBS domain-containing protein
VPKKACLIMNDGIKHIIKAAPILTPYDTVRRAAGLISASDGSRVFVRDRGQIIGAVSDRAIVAFLASADDVEAASKSPIGPLVEPGVLLVNLDITARQAAEIFASTEADVLPVIDNLGGYQGVIYRSDLMGYLTQNLRPPAVAGMATPLGVYLTTGSVSGGTGSLGLFLTGVALALMMLAAELSVEGLIKLFSIITNIRADIMLRSVPLIQYPNIYDVPFYASVVLSIIIFFLLLRFSPLSGYHAAEHMTVHAIEAGETLTAENVKSMPRVHPRCGTNLLAAAGVFLIIATRISSQFGVMIALLVVVVGWRTIGAWLQYFVTTRTPSPRELAKGVEAGNDLLRQYQEQPNLQLVGFKRIWKLGFIQTAAGLFSTLWVFQSVFKIPIL